MKRCYRCHGTKRIQGIGWIDIECPVCEGIGITDKLPGLPKSVQAALAEVMPSDVAPARIAPPKPTEKASSGRPKGKMARRS